MRPRDRFVLAALLALWAAVAKAQEAGFFVGFTYKSLSLNVYVFNPGWETPTVVSSLAINF